MSIAFKKPSIEEIFSAIQKELKDIPLKTLSIEPREGIKLEPIYQKTDSKIHIPFSTNDKIVFQLFTIEKEFIQSTQQQILTALENGQNGLILDFKHIDWTEEEVAQLLKEVRLDYICVEYLNLNEYTKKSLHSYLSSYPFSLSWQNTMLSEVVYCISDVRFLDEAASIISKNLDKASIHIELSGNYFWDISKIRAFKILLFQQAKLQAKIPQFILIGETTLANKSSEQLESNILKLTTEAMSGMIGGCEGLWIKPFDTLTDNPFSQRISRNIFHLLQEESYLHFVEDPSAGSYFIENYTHQIAKQIYQRLS